MPPNNRNGVIVLGHTSFYEIDGGWDVKQSPVDAAIHPGTPKQRKIKVYAYNFLCKEAELFIQRYKTLIDNYNSTNPAEPVLIGCPEFWKELAVAIPPTEQRSKQMCAVVNFILKHYKAAIPAQKIEYNWVCYLALRQAILCGYTQIDIFRLIVAEKSAAMTVSLSEQEGLCVHLAMKLGCTFDVLKLLTDDPVISRYKDRHGLTLLHWAVILNRSVEEVEFIYNQFPDAANSVSFAVSPSTSASTEIQEPQYSYRLGLSPPDKNFNSDEPAQPDFFVPISCTPLSMALDYNIMKETQRTNESVIFFLLSKSQKVLLVPDMNLTIPLHKFLRGHYSTEKFGRGISLFLDMYSSHAYAAAFIRDEYNEIPLQIVYGLGFSKSIINQLGRFTSECIDKCISMVESTKRVHRATPATFNIAQQYVVIIEDPMCTPPPEIDAMFSNSGFVFHNAEDGTLSRVMGLISHFLSQKVPDGSDVDAVKVELGPTHLFSRNMAMKTLDVFFAQKMMQDVAVFVSTKTYQNFDAILDKLRNKNLSWFRDYKAKIKKEIVRFRAVQPDWTGLEKEDSLCFFAQRRLSEPVPRVPLITQAQSEEDATRNANELLASLEAEAGMASEASIAASLKKSRRKLAKQLVEDKEIALRAVEAERIIAERTAHQQARRQNEAALELDAQRKMMRDHTAKMQAKAVEEERAKAKAASRALEKQRRQEAKALQKKREKQAADDYEIQAMQQKSMEEAKVHAHVFGELMDDFEEALLQKAAMDAVTRPGKSTGLIQHLFPNHLEEEVKRLRALIETLTENKECTICLTHERNTLFRPCGHVCICWTCWEAMPTPKACPLCRAKIESAERIFS